MEELFRFSVVRAVTKSQPNVSALATTSIDRATGKLVNNSTFQAALQDQIQQLIAAGEDSESLWQRVAVIAAQFVITNASAVLDNGLWDDLSSLLDGLTILATQPLKANSISQADIQQVLAQFPNLTGAAATAYQPKLSDLFLSLIVIRRGGPSALDRMIRTQNLSSSVLLLGTDPALPDISKRLAACSLVIDGLAALTPAVGLTPAEAQASFAAALGIAENPTIAFPPGIFQPLPKPVLGVGFRELQVVKQNIRRYQAAEISQIENILKGESRSHVQRHRLSTETDTTESTSTTTVTDKELTTNDQTDIKNEAQDQVNSATKIDAGVHAQYSGPSFKLQADLNVSYSKSDAETKQYSSDTAKDVTQKAATTVTEVISRTQTTKIIESFADIERHRFDNTNGTSNISGIYQWIEKVYLCQVFNLGRHMLIDITVPEPGANLLAMATATPNDDPPPVQPHPLGTIFMDATGRPALDNYGRMQLGTPLNPLDLTANALSALNVPNPNFYGTWVAYYGATGVTAPPAGQLTFSKGETFDYKDDDDKSVADQIQIDDGYAASTVTISVSAMRNDNPGQPYSENVYVDVAIGGVTVHLPWPNNLRSTTLLGTAAINPPATGSVNFTIYGRNIDQMSVNVELICAPQQTTIDQWKLQTYAKIVDAYTNLEQTYEAAIAARKIEGQTVGPLGSEDPEANRICERVELKRACIAIFDNNNATVAGTNVVTLQPLIAPIPPNPATPQLPEPVLDTSQSLGARIRWFEQAFEWENVAYVNYPYFWGRRSRWVPNLLLTNGDPLFLSFLRAGYARVVVPVRLGFENAVQFYLNTGLPWLGGDLPPVGDESQNPLYLDVAEEIKNLTGGGYSGETEVPVGDPWEYVLPTTVLKLRDNSTLPEWYRAIPAGVDPIDPTYASNAPDGPWTWLDGPPPANSNQAANISVNTPLAQAKMVKLANASSPKTKAAARTTTGKRFSTKAKT